MQSEKAKPYSHQGFDPGTLALRKLSRGTDFRVFRIQTAATSPTGDGS